MTTNREFGEKLLKEAEWIFEKDLKTAVEEENYNIAVRRAQEVVELTLKGCLRILGIDYPKVHDAGGIFTIEAGKKFPFKESSLKEIERISRWLAEARAPSFYGEKDFTNEDAKKALDDANFVLNEIKTMIKK
ncbi:MAG: HEPN domain-containing protein [Candidatus Methanoperedens sp.]|nr:HEPN domain-containing protein [Candidatus Methanoperedens sp.]MCZ7371266.1 HEPN domain-containing protein [Candidatus Methanoperedens sp.]